jgi:hypothetical protein
MSGRFEGNPEPATQPEQGPEERSPRAWGAEIGSRGQEGLRRHGGSQTPKAGLSGGTVKPFERLVTSQTQKRAFLFGYAEGPRTEARSFAEKAGSA